MACGVCVCKIISLLRNYSQERAWQSFICLQMVSSISGCLSLWLGNSALILRSRSDHSTNDESLRPHHRLYPLIKHFVLWFDRGRCTVNWVEVKVVELFMVCVWMCGMYCCYFGWLVIHYKSNSELSGYDQPHCNQPLKWKTKFHHHLLNSFQSFTTFFWRMP